MPNSYKIRGIEPPDLGSQTPEVRKVFWGWVVELGLKRKDKELSQGLDKDGKPLRPIREKTRKYRKSAMTPSGKGSPSAPPLTPGYQKSRTRSLLAGRAFTTHAEFYWRYDAWTGDTWAKVLTIQAKLGRDVFGLSPAGTAWVKARAWAKWAAYKAGTLKAAATTQAGRAVAIPRVGRYEMANATMGMGVGGAPVTEQTFQTGQWTGGMTPEEWAKYFRQTASARPPGRAARPKSQSPISGPGYNRLLQHVWGQGPRPGPSRGSAAPRTARPGPRKPEPTPLPTFGPSKATLRPYPGYTNANILAAAKRLLGPSATLQDLASLAGATDDLLLRVQLTYDPRGTAIYLHGENERYEISRKIGLDSNGKPYVYAAQFFVKEGYQGQGIGRQVFGRMVEAAVRLKVDKFKTFALRSPGANGYYTWPLFGYDGPIPQDIIDELPASLATARYFTELMRTEEGRAWWRANGESMDLVFDVRTGSRSQMEWRRYLRSKEAR